MHAWVVSSEGPGKAGYCAHCLTLRLPSNEMDSCSRASAKRIADAKYLVVKAARTLEPCADHLDEVQQLDPFWLQGRLRYLLDALAKLDSAEHEQ